MQHVQLYLYLYYPIFNQLATALDVQIIVTLVQKLDALSSTLSHIQPFA